MASTEFLALAKQHIRKAYGLFRSKGWPAVADRIEIQSAYTLLLAGHAAGDVADAIAHFADKLHGPRPAQDWPTHAARVVATAQQKATAHQARGVRQTSE